MQRRMLRPYRRIIQPRRNRMCLRDLPILVLQYVRECSLQNSGNSTAKTRRMLAQFRPASAGLDSNQPYIAILDEFVKRPNRIRSAAHARNHSRRHPSFLL